MKEEKSRNGGAFDGATLRRNQAKVSTRIIDSPKLRQQLADSGYSTSDGIDKRLWHDSPTTTNGSTPEVETSPTSSAHNRTLTMDNVSPSTPNSSHSNSYTPDQFDSAVGNSQTRANGANNNTRFVLQFYMLHGNSIWFMFGLNLTKRKKENTKQPLDICLPYIFILFIFVLIYYYF